MEIFNLLINLLDKLLLPNSNSKCVVICPTAIHLDYLSKNKNGFYVGAQNVSEQRRGLTQVRFQFAHFRNKC